MLVNGAYVSRIGTVQYMRKIYTRLALSCVLLWFSMCPWWRHQMETFSALLTLCAGNSPVPVNSMHKGQWRGALMFSLICVWINDWVNNREAGDLRCYLGHYDVNAMCHSTHRGQVTHICGSKLSIVRSDNGLSPDRRRATATLLLVGPLGINVSKIVIEIHTFSFKKMHLKTSSGKLRPCCLGLNENVFIFSKM